MIALFFSLMSALLLSAMPGQAAEERVPYKDLREKGAGFYGPGREREAPDTLSAVRLGLMAPSRGNAGRQLRWGVELAVLEANAAGGYLLGDGRRLPYEIVFRPDDGPWGVVAQQVIRLSREDGVWAVIGALDGERAHVAELMAAKLWIPVVTPAAADLSIDYANVPWVFRLMPDDRSQAELLLRAAEDRGFQRLALASEGARDARVAAGHVAQVANRLGRSLLLHVEYHPFHPPGACARRLIQANPDAVVIWGGAAGALALIIELRGAGLDVPVLVPAALVAPEVAALHASLGRIVGVAPLDMDLPDPRLQAFRRRYARETGESPSALAAYAYEAGQVVISALERSGLNRARLRDELAQMRHNGLTGQVSFNSLGGYDPKLVLVELSQGRWVRID